ncbi:hypothetical protein [Roseisolibacter sp. H3M3-2]|uniref:hypothetical protein n=1 Tax=Roseisolibacter sp. H3M3-2 TaxID=3031323 RepID=UPI0023DC4851|nr:hypothetical protein [Roseisolibacter sp. H3M3-2]MDF1501931.1 hypothetical protein [Roseisolibacter sp. H3M3-2]
MTAAAMNAELRRREPRQAAFGLGCAACAALAFAAAAVDARTFGGVRLWLKPAKFFVSIAVYALTWAWFAGYVRADRRDARALRVAVWTLIGTAAFELAYITFQAARAEASHFNGGDALHAALYGLMGIAAVALIAAALPLALAIARHPAPDVAPADRRAAVAGLVLCFLLGGLLGGYMSAQAGHAVGVEAGHLPVVGWNRAGGDLRVAHFLGLHVLQAAPLAVFAAGVLGVRRRGVALAAAAAAWGALTLASFAQAVAGRPLVRSAAVPATPRL